MKVSERNHAALDLSSSIWSRLKINLFWNLLAAVFTQGSTFLTHILIARILGRTIYGEYAMIQSTLLSMSIMAQMATGFTATRYLAEFRSTDKARAGRITGLCFIVSGITACIAASALLGGAGWLASSILKAPHLSSGLVIGAGFLFFSVINGYQIGALAGLESYRFLAVAGILSGCLCVALCGLGSWTWGLNGALAGLAISSLIGCLIHHYFVKAESARQQISLTYRGILKEHKVLTQFALPAALSGFIMMPATWLGNAFLVRQPGGYGELALYSAALNLRVFAVFLPRNFYRVIYSLLSNQFGLGDESRYRQTYWANIVISGVTVLVAGGLILILGPRLLALYGKNFAEAYPVLVILMVAAPIEALAQAIYQLITSLEKMWISLFGITLPSYAVFLVLAYILSPNFQAKGLALAFTIGWAVNLLGTALWAWRYGLNIQRRPVRLTMPGG